MATKLYYGYSESAASSAVKEVIISKVEYLVVDGTPIEIEAGRDLFLTRDLNNEFNPEGLPVGEEGENTIALVGPTRMDYEKALAALEYLIKELNKMYSKDKKEEKGGFHHITHNWTQSRHI